MLQSIFWWNRRIVFALVLLSFVFSNAFTQYLNSKRKIKWGSLIFIFLRIKCFNKQWNSFYEKWKAQQTTHSTFLKLLTSKILYNYTIYVLLISHLIQWLFYFGVYITEWPCPSQWIYKTFGNMEKSTLFFIRNSYF